MRNVKRLRVALGTLVAVEATASSTSAAQAAVEAAFAAIVEANRLMHPRMEGSDLARINAAPVNSKITVAPGIQALLELARRLNTLTDGVFDPCLPNSPGRLQDIESGTDHIVCRAPVTLDFGGFAKGYAVDRAIDALQESGCAAGLVNAGGDLRVFGSHEDPVLLRGPDGSMLQVEINDAAIAVSDAGARQRPIEHQGYYICTAR